MNNSQYSSKSFYTAIIAMMLLVAISNYLVTFPINDYITWAAFTYPITFFVTDLTARQLGARPARRVVYVGFALGVLLSILLASPRIALASGIAFLAAQLLDIYVFRRLQGNSRWWQAPLFSSSIGSAVDTALFFSIAFVGTALPWITLGIGDFLVKLLFALLLLLPFRLAIGWIRSPTLTQ